MLVPEIRQRLVPLAASYAKISPLVLAAYTVPPSTVSPAVTSETGPNSAFHSRAPCSALSADTPPVVLLLAGTPR